MTDGGSSKLDQNNTEAEEEEIVGECWLFFQSDADRLIKRLYTSLLHVVTATATQEKIL